jgi:hypothetical protein
MWMALVGESTKETTMATKPAFLFDESDKFESLSGGKVRFTVFASAQPGTDSRLGQFELCVEADRAGIVDVDALHGWTEEELTKRLREQVPASLEAAEEVVLVRWAMRDMSVARAARDYFDRIDEHNAEMNAEEAGYV